MATDRSRRWLSTVRVRITIAACAVVATALVLGSFALVGLARRAMVSNLDNELTLRAADIATAAAHGKLPARLTGGFDDNSVAQAVNRSGRVVAQSNGIRGHAPIAAIADVSANDRLRTVHDPPMGDGAAYRVLARRIHTAGGDVVLLVGGSLEATNDTINTVVAILAVGVPALLVLVGALAWWIVGRTLQPVETMRREVDALSDDALDRRIPEPGTADEISRLARTMNRMLERLEASRAHERRFVADAAHELRSPLANIRAELEVALAHPDTTDWQAVTASVRDQHDRLGVVVENLLVLVRADEGRLARAHEAVDLDEIVLEQVGAVRARRRVRVDLSGVEGGRVDGDSIELERVVQNVLDNAERYAETVIRIELAPQDGTVQLVVEDDGPGIPESDRERVFERFTRVDAARSRARGGAGLGLAIVREIVSAHGGTTAVTAARHSESGARVVVSLRQASADAGVQQAAHIRQ
jgi:signal transduction histidine kinase